MCDRKFIQWEDRMYGKGHGCYDMFLLTDDEMQDEDAYTWTECRSPRA